MFATPRAKPGLVPPPKKRKTKPSEVEEVLFDVGAREEFLTGFHKRKLQRIKQAQDEATKRAREEKIEIRKKLREDRQRQVEEHVQAVNALLREAELAGNINQEGLDGEDDDDEEPEWDGFADSQVPEVIDHEEEYIDEDKYTTVTIESVSVTRDGLKKPEREPVEDEAPEKPAPVDDGGNGAKTDARQKKRPKKKFRYETKVERQLSERKQKAKKAKLRSKR